ncbi:MAG: MG2 domain-containing protein [Bacteroidota bacterium]
MRKIYTRCLFLLICFQCSTAQYNFDKKWKKIEALEIEGKFSSAFKKVERLNRKANETQNTEQIVKSFIYRMKFSLLLTENTEVTLLQTVRNEIDTQNFPTNAILENIYARLLSDYFIKYQYKIRKRSTVASDETPHDIQLWNTARFMQEIHKRFQHSIAQEKALLQLPVEDYMTFLDGKATTKKYRSSLYDILIYNMLDFYKSSSQYRFQIDDSDKLEDLAPTSEFLQRKFTIHNIEEIGYDNTMYLFQKLENIYKDQKEAFVDVVLQRLQFVISKTANHKFDTPYVDALERLAAQFPNDPLEALIRYEIANHYHKISKQHYSKSKETHEKLRVKAMDISNKMIAKYPNSEGAIQCKLLQKQIEYKSIKFRSELYSIPNKASLAQLKTRNVDTIFVKAYKVSQQFARTQSTAKRDSLIGDFLLSAQEEFTKKISTNTPKDYYEHSTEISIPSLPIGRYLIAISNTAEQSKNNVIAFDFIEKTNLTATETEFDNEKMYTILHRTTGKPIPNVKIHVRDAKKTINQTERTNSYGNARVPKRINTTNVTQYITFNKDTLYQANNSLGYRYRNQKKEKGRWVAQPFVLMDRSIYRPGQTAYFKIIVLQEKNNISSVVPNEFFEIEIDAASGQEIKKIRLKTNEFGAISGSFVIPKNAGTGRFSFNVLEYYEYEEDDHPFWDYIDEFYDTYHDFQVE